MNINKYIIIILIIFLLPFNIKAEECKKDDIVISKVELNEVRGNAEETSDPNNYNNQINLNAKMNVIGDSLTYKVVIKNTSNSDYVFDKNQITKDYINYDISYGDNSNIIKAGEEKTIYLKLKYDSKPQVDNLSNGILQENNLVSFQLINEKGDSLINPETGNKVFLIFLYVLLIASLIFTKSNKKVSITIIILSLILIPQMVKAVCTCSLDINLNLEIDAKEAMFLPGPEVNVAMKELAGDDTSSERFGYIDTNIIAIKKSEIEPINSDKEEKNIVSTPESPYPIYMWYEDGTIYWWSEDKTPSLNRNASSMFNRCTKLETISGVEDWDLLSADSIAFIFNVTSISDLSFLKKWNTTNIKNMNGVFSNNTVLQNLSGIENWSTSNVTTMAYLLYESPIIVSLKELKNWDTSKVENMAYMFYNKIILNSIEDLGGWDTSRVNNMISMFYKNFNLQTIKGLDNWNTTNVTNMSFMFRECTQLQSVEPLSNWNVSNVTTLESIFWGDSNIASVDLSKWDTSSVTSMADVFYGLSRATKIDVSGWKTSNVTDMRFMFYGLTLDELDISSFDTRNVTNFRQMFNNSTNLRNIYVGENWNNEKASGDIASIFAADTFLPNFSRQNNNYRSIIWAHYNEGGYLTLKTN